MKLFKYEKNFILKLLESEIRRLNDAYYEREKHGRDCKDLENKLKIANKLCTDFRNNCYRYDSELKDLGLI